MNTDAKPVEDWATMVGMDWDLRVESADPRPLDEQGLRKRLRAHGAGAGPGSAGRPGPGPVHPQPAQHPAGAARCRPGDRPRRRPGNGGAHPAAPSAGRDGAGRGDPRVVRRGQRRPPRPGDLVPRPGPVARLRVPRVLGDRGVRPVGRRAGPPGQPGHEPGRAGARRRLDVGRADVRARPGVRDDLVAGDPGPRPGAGPGRTRHSRGPRRGARTPGRRGHHDPNREPGPLGCGDPADRARPARRRAGPDRVAGHEPGSGRTARRLRPGRCDGACCGRLGSPR